MAVVPVMTLYNGRLGTVKPGDTPDVEAGVNAIDFTNEQGVQIVKGQPVYLSSADSVSLARSNAEATSEAIGLVNAATIEDAASGSVLLEGPITLADWTDITGAVTLTAGAFYYLDSAAAGKLTTVSPSANPNTSKRVGQALNTTTLRVHPYPFISL